jgi:hypothetical protein
MDDLNLQVHGYATQAFVYSTNDNWNTTDSTDGSAAWTEAVVNVSAQPEPKLRIGVQARYSLLGIYGNAITLDWAQADYKVDERFGFRAGKVKTPAGLLNETQDIDPAHLWILLPQSVYPLVRRNDSLAHYGGVAYGTFGLGESFGKLEYRAFGGVRVISANDPYLQPLRDVGLNLPNGFTSPVVGGTLRWDAPIPGLMVGATQNYMSGSGEITAGPYQGTFTSPKFFWPSFFAKYERGKAMLAGEYSRFAADTIIQFPGAPAAPTRTDVRAFYAMASYKVFEKLTAGIYYSSSIDREAVSTSSRYQKDWAVAARYDFNPFLYVKVEQHFIDGIELGFDASDNLNLLPDTRMTLLKLGVSF